MSLLIPYRQGTRWGYSNNKGKIVVECVYDEVQEFALENELLMVRKDGANFLINRSGDIVVSDFERYQLCEKDANLLVIVWKVLHTKHIEKGTADYDLFPREPGAYYPDILEISICEFRVYDVNGSLIETINSQSFEEVKQLLSCSDLPARAYSSTDSKKSLRPMNLPDPDSCSGYKGLFVDPDDRTDPRFEYAYTLDFVGGIAPVQTATDQWIYINENNEQVSKRSYLRALPFHQSGIAKVVTGFANCKVTDPGNQNNWTSIPDNLWIPEDADFGFIDWQGNEYWED